MVDVSLLRNLQKVWSNICKMGYREIYLRQQSKQNKSVSHKHSYSEVVLSHAHLHWKNPTKLHSADWIWI